MTVSKKYYCVNFCFDYASGQRKQENASNRGMFCFRGLIIVNYRRVALSTTNAATILTNKLKIFSMIAEQFLNRQFLSS